MKQRHLIYLSLLLISSLNLHSQTETYNQIYGEFQFSRAVSDKWAAELDIGSAFSNTPSNNKILSTNTQRYVSGWAHYYFSPRWKFSASLAYYYNKDVPEIGQYKAPEYRLSLQAIYYIHKTNYKLSTRMRGEIRFIINEEGVLVDQYRYRQMIKFIKAINSHVLRKGVFYGVTSEELYFKANTKSEGITFIDRNRFEIGAGYLITDNLQIEMLYFNEFLPRDDVNKIYNGAKITLTVNNLFPNIRKKLKSKSTEAGQQD